MKYADGKEARIGDMVQIDRLYRGRVIACIDTKTHLTGHEGWEYLGTGIMVDTDFAGLVHYLPDTEEELILLHRGDGS